MKPKLFTLSPKHQSAAAGSAAALAMVLIVVEDSLLPAPTTPSAAGSAAASAASTVDSWWWRQGQPGPQVIDSSPIGVESSPATTVPGTSPGFRAEPVETVTETVSDESILLPPRSPSLGTPQAPLLPPTWGAPQAAEAESVEKPWYDTLSWYDSAHDLVRRPGDGISESQLGESLPAARPASASEHVESQPQLAKKRRVADEIAGPQVAPGRPQWSRRVQGAQNHRKRSTR